MTVQSDLGADHSEVYGSSENNAIQTHAPKDIRNHLNAPCLGRDRWVFGGLLPSQTNIISGAPVPVRDSVSRKLEEQTLNDDSSLYMAIIHKGTYIHAHLHIYGNPHYHKGTHTHTHIHTCSSNTSSCSRPKSAIKWLKKTEWLYIGNKHYPSWDLEMELRKLFYSVLFNILKHRTLFFHSQKPKGRNSSILSH